MVIGDGQQAELWVRFDPTYCQDQVSRVVEEVTNSLFFFFQPDHIVTFIEELIPVQRAVLKEFLPPNGLKTIFKKYTEPPFL